MHLEKRFYIAPETDVILTEAETAVLASSGSTEGFGQNTGSWTA